MNPPHFCHGHLNTSNEIFAEALQILEEEMAHLLTVREHIDKVSDGLHRTLMVLSNMKDNVIPHSKNLTD
jgi:hypothetical protein